MLDSLERAINDVSDQDWSWWPFLWLRPEKTETFTLGRSAILSLLYGVPLGGLMMLVAAFSRPEFHEIAPVLAAIFPVLLFFVGSSLVAPMWNRRAERLAQRALRACEPCDTE